MEEAALMLLSLGIEKANANVVDRRRVVEIVRSKDLILDKFKVK
jgi:hypothetical protein